MLSAQCSVLSAQCSVLSAQCSVPRVMKVVMEIYIYIFYISFAEIFCIFDLSKGLYSLVELFNNIYSLDLDNLHVINTSSFAGQIL